MWKTFLKILLIVLFLFSFYPAPAFAALNITSLSTDTINSPDDVIIINASASGLQSSTQYLETTFTKDGETSNFFGLTLNANDEWYQYKSSPSTSELSSYFYSFTPVNGSWNGQLQAKLDIHDTGFKGPGKYNIKLLKFITSSSSPSNIVSINVNVSLPPSPSPTSIPMKEPTVIKAPPIQPTKLPTNIPTRFITITKIPSKAASISAAPTSVLGTNTNSTKKEEKSKKTLVESANRINTSSILIIIGSIFILLCAIVIYFRIEKNT